MKEERMKILKMLEDEIIDADEALMLLNALNDCTGADDEPDIDIGERFRKSYKEIEAELKPLPREIFEGIISVLDEVSDALNEGRR